MQQANPNQELQLLDSALFFLSRAPIEGKDSERMTEVKQFLAGRMGQIQQMMQAQAKAQAEQPPVPEAE